MFIRGVPCGDLKEDAFGGLGILFIARSNIGQDKAHHGVVHVLAEVMEIMFVLHLAGNRIIDQVIGRLVRRSLVENRIGPFLERLPLPTAGCM